MYNWVANHISSPEQEFRVRHFLEQRFALTVDLFGNGELEMLVADLGC